MSPVRLLGRSDSGIAIEAEGSRVSWRELDRRTDERAADLTAHGLTSGTRTVLRLPLGLDYVVTLLAALRAGTAPVPIGPDPPQAFVDELVRACVPEAIVDPDGSITTSAGQPEGSAPGKRDRDEGYLLFTSGSSGNPKGVIGAASGLTERIGWAKGSFFTPGIVRCAARASPTFIDSLTEILGCLHAGNTLVIAPPETRHDLGLLARYLREHRIEQVTITPSCVPVLAQTAAAPFPDVRRWILSGEPLRSSWANLVFELSPEAEVINSYGSTEVSGDVAYLRLSPADLEEPLVPIGAPVPGVDWLLQPSDRMHDEPEAAELLVGGAQVALGYVGDASGSPNFISAPAGTPNDTRRWFRTGDLLIQRGPSFSYVGRADDVRKVRGRRVDLQGVVAALERLVGVHQAHAEVMTSGEGATRLHAWVTPDRHGSLDPVELRRRLREMVPLDIVPDTISVLHDLPRTTSGKVDRRSLTSVAAVGAGLPEEFTTDLEVAIGSIIRKCAPDVTIDRTSSLEAVGLDSFQLVEIAEATSEALGIKIEALDVFAWETIESAAATLSATDTMDAPCVRTMRAGGGHLAIGFLPPAIGTGLSYFRILDQLDHDGPVVTFEENRAAVERLEEGGCAGLGAYFGEAFQRRLPSARAALVGWSFGGLLAPHVAHALDLNGVDVTGMVLLDPARVRTTDSHGSEDWTIRRILTDFDYSDLPDPPLTVEHALSIVRARLGPLETIRAETLRGWVDVMTANIAAAQAPFPPAPAVRTLVIRATRTQELMDYPAWAQGRADLGDGGLIELTEVDTTHFDLLRSGAIIVAALISQFIAEG